MLENTPTSIPSFDFMGDTNWYLAHVEEIKTKYVGNWILVRDKRIWFFDPNKDIVRMKAIELFGKINYFLFGIEVPDRDTEFSDTGGESTNL